MLPYSLLILMVILIQISSSHPILKRCLASPCRDDGESKNIKILLETVDDETRKPVQQATGYYIANNNYSLSLTPPPPVTPTPFPTSSQPSHQYIPQSPYQPSSLNSPTRSFNFLLPSSSPSSIVRSPIFLRSDPLPSSSHPVASVYKNPSGVVRPSSQLQPPPFVVVKVKKVSSTPPIEIITTPRSEATLTPTTTVSPSHRFPYTTSYPHSFHFIPPSTSSSHSTMPSSSSSIASTSPPLPSQLSIEPSTTVLFSDRIETTTTATAQTNSRVEMSEEEFRQKVAAMMNKNQLLCTMFGICHGLNDKDVPPTVTPKSVYNPSLADHQFEFIPRIVNAPTTPSPFQFVFEFASTIAPTLKKLNKQLPIFSAQYAANPSPIQPNPKGFNPNKMTLSSLLSSIVSSPLASHCPSCVQLLLNLCPPEGRSSKDCLVTTTSKPITPLPFHSPIRSQPTFAFSFPNPITGQQIKAAAVVPTTTTLRPWQTTYSRTSYSTTVDPFAPLMDDDVQYDFSFDKRPSEAIEYDDGGGYGLVGERRGVLPWSIKRAG